MRGVAVLIAYLLGLGAIISFGIAGLMALQTPTQPLPTAPVSAAATAQESAFAVAIGGKADIAFCDAHVCF